jgi:hypothetical protein
MLKNYKLQTKASPDPFSARKKLVDLFKASPLPTEKLLVNWGLYLRSSVLAKTLNVDELYQKIVYVPGVIMKFGTWWRGKSGTL